MAKPEDMYQCQTVDCGYVCDPDRGDKRKKIFRPLAGPGSVVAEQS